MEGVAQPTKQQQYQQAIIDLLTRQAQIAYAYDEIEPQLILDVERGHYLIIDVGWSADHNERIYGTQIHIDLKDGKVLIQCNNTEVEIARSLIAAGVKKDDIIIGFVEPEFQDIATAQLN